MNDVSPDPVQPNPYTSSSQNAETPIAVANQGDGTGGVIPYKNPSALLAYYFGIFSFIPLLGFFLAVPAFVLGLLGLRARKRNPVVRGTVHAWIGVVLGGIFSVVWGLAFAAILFGMSR